MNQRTFLISTILYCLLLAVLLSVFPTGELHLLLNSYHALWLDYVNRYWTLIAEYGVWIVAAALLFYRFDAVAMVVSTFALSGGVTQVIKHIAKAPRPVTWFAENMADVQLPLVEGVRMSLYNSFPSGHTTTFFALTVALCYVVSNTSWSQRKKNICQLALFLVAAIGGYSRIYLSQHFCADVLAGCIIGTTMSLLLCSLAERYHLSEKAWACKSLVSLYSQKAS